MKFSHIELLDHFIRENSLFDDYLFMHEIVTGGSSYNFYIVTKHEKYLLKLMKSADNFARLKRILQKLNYYVPLSIECFENYMLLATPYINGRNIRYSDINASTLNDIKKQLNQLQNLQNDGIDLMPATIENFVTVINNYFMSENCGWLYKIIKNTFWKRIKKLIVVLPAGKTIIHGDLTINNILIDKQNKAHVIDFDKLQYGYEVQDYMYLFLQLSGFRGLYGSRKHLNKLFSLLDLRNKYSLDECLYGVQYFYLYMLLRRICGLINKKQNIRKTICLLICLWGYFRVHKIMQNYFSDAT